MTRQKRGINVDVFCKELKLGAGSAQTKLHELANLVQNDRNILAMTMATVETGYYGLLGKDKGRRYAEEFIGNLLTISQAIINPAEKDDKKGKEALFAFVEVVGKCGPFASDVIVSAFAKSTDRVVKLYENNATARYSLEAMTKILSDYPAARGVEAGRLARMLDFMSRNLKHPELIMNVAEVIGRDFYKSALRDKTSVPRRTFAVKADLMGWTTARQLRKDRKIEEDDE